MPLRRHPEHPPGSHKASDILDACYSEETPTANSFTRLSELTSAVAGPCALNAAEAAVIAAVKRRFRTGLAVAKASDPVMLPHLLSTAPTPDSKVVVTDTTLAPSANQGPPPPPDQLKGDPGSHIASGLSDSPAFDFWSGAGTKLVPCSGHGDDEALQQAAFLMNGLSPYRTDMVAVGADRDGAGSGRAGQCMLGDDPASMSLLPAFQLSIGELIQSEAVVHGAVSGAAVDWSALSGANVTTECGLARMWTGECSASAAALVISALPSQQPRHQQQRADAASPLSQQPPQPTAAGSESCTDSSEDEEGVESFKAANTRVRRGAGLVTAGLRRRARGNVGAPPMFPRSARRRSVVSREAAGRYGKLLMSSANWRYTEMYDIHDSLLLSNLTGRRRGGPNSGVGGGGSPGQVQPTATTSISNFTAVEVAGVAMAPVTSLPRTTEAVVKSPLESEDAVQALDVSALADNTASGIGGDGPFASGGDDVRRPYPAWSLSRQQQQQQQSVPAPAPASRSATPPLSLSLRPLVNGAVQCQPPAPARGALVNWGATLEALLEQVTPRTSYHAASSGGAGVGAVYAFNTSATTTAAVRPPSASCMVERSSQGAQAPLMKRWAQSFRKPATSDTGAPGPAASAAASPSHTSAAFEVGPRKPSRFSIEEGRPPAITVGGALAPPAAAPRQVRTWASARHLSAAAAASVSVDAPTPAAADDDTAAVAMAPDSARFGSCPQLPHLVSLPPSGLPPSGGGEASRLRPSSWTSASTTQFLPVQAAATEWLTSSDNLSQLAVQLPTSVTTAMGRSEVAGGGPGTKLAARAPRSRLGSMSGCVTTATASRRFNEAVQPLGPDALAGLAGPPTEASSGRPQEIPNKHPKLTRLLRALLGPRATEKAAALGARLRGNGAGKRSSSSGRIEGLAAQLSRQQQQQQQQKRSDASADESSRREWLARVAPLADAVLSA